MGLSCFLWGTAGCLCLQELRAGHGGTALGGGREMVLGGDRHELVQNLAKHWCNFPCCLRMAFSPVFLGQTLVL